MNLPCPTAIHCGDYPFANLSSEGVEYVSYTARGYCCDTTLRAVTSLISQEDANEALQRTLAVSCPDCDPPKLYCADASCPDGSKLTTKCVPTSQADADALAAAAAMDMLPFCDLKDLYQANCACPDGTTDPHTTYSNISQEVADADCEKIPKTCPPPCNTEQCCDVTLENGTLLHYCLPAETVCDVSLALANAQALAQACDSARNLAQLSSLPSFICLLQSFSQNVTLTGVTGVFAWSISAGTLPPGIVATQTSNYTALLTGTPTTAGTYTFAIRVMLGANNYIQRTYTMVVFGFTTISDLPDGTVGTPYSEQIVADGGSGNYLFTITDGALPDGLTLGDTGFITGTPLTEETALFTVTVQDLVTTSMVCSLEFQIDVTAAADPFDTATVITAAKSHYVIGHDTTVVFGDTRCVSGTTYPTGIVFYMEGAVILGNGNCGIYGTADPYSPGILVASKVLHGELNGTGSYHDSSSGVMDVFPAGYWPGTVSIDAAALAAFQALKPTVAGTLAIDLVGTFTYVDASASLSLLNGSTFVFQWTGGNFAVYKRHDNSLTPTGVFYFYVGTANPIAQVTIS